MSEVSIVKCNEYNQEDVDLAIEKVIANLGGINNFIKENSKVLLKVNLLFGRHPDKMVNTHPSVIEGVIKLLKKHKCHVFIGDSPALGSCRGASKYAGYLNLEKKLDCKIINFNNSVKIKNPSKNSIFKNLEVASEIYDYDYIINLPKVKTHGQMGLTLGVKNMFGCITGTKKLQWHLKAGINKDYFAKMLVEVYENIKPVLTITDGITGMEGNGPQWGSPKKLGVILASTDAVASDLVVAHLVNYNQEKLFTLRAARDKGIGTNRIDDIKFFGENLSSLDIVDFKKVPLASLEFKIPSFIFGSLKDIFATKPSIDYNKCITCKLCMEICPAKAITMKNNKIFMNHRNCIRCFCCQELCPEGAISVKENWLSNFMP
jgi:uncharacterized protein (DUF362 family)/Pyruvate/2-oxoacid:ferredoxin oxidoreductase delta subunit